MPVTADSYFPFDGQEVAESEWRAMARHWAADGVLVTGQAVGDYTDFLAVTAGTALQVLVSAGAAWVGGHYAEWETQSALTVGANASGSTRIDVVVARADLVANDVELDIVAGTPGAGAPSLTQNSSTWEIPLGQYSVTNGASAPSSFVDRRTYAGGVPVPHELRLRRAAAVSVTNGSTATITWDTEDADTAGFWSSGTTVTVPPGAGGLYLITLVVDPDGSSAHALAGIGLNGGSNVWGGKSELGGSPAVCTVLTRLADAGTVTGSWGSQNATANFTASLTMARVGR